MAKQGRVKQLDIICSQPSNNTLKSGLLSENGDRPSVLQKTKVPFLPYGGVMLVMLVVIMIIMVMMIVVMKAYLHFTQSHHMKIIALRELHSNSLQGAE